jgi:hypothetical protein
MISSKAMSRTSCIVPALHIGNQIFGASVEAPPTQDNQVQNDGGWLQRRNGNPTGILQQMP